MINFYINYSIHFINTFLKNSLINEVEHDLNILAKNR